MSTSDKNVFHPGNETDWTPFEMASFDPPVVAPAAIAAAAPPDPDKLRREILKLREAAQVRGQAEGYAAGHAQGLTMGKEEGHKQGYTEGYANGVEAGHSAGSEQAHQATEQLLTLADACADSITHIEQAMGQALINLSIQIAEQVLRSTLDTQPEKILDLIHDITHLDSEKDAVLKLSLHPDDLELVRKYLQQEPNIGLWRLSADPSIARGGCIAETGLGEIDATLQTRWKRVTASLGYKTSFIEDN